MLISQYLGFSSRLDRQPLSFVLWHNSAIVCGEQIWVFQAGSVFEKEGLVLIWKPKQTEGLDSVGFTRLVSYSSHFHFGFKINYSRGTLPKCLQTQNSPKRPMQTLPFQLSSPKTPISQEILFVIKDLQHCFGSFFVICTCRKVYRIRSGWIPTRRMKLECASLCIPRHLKADLSNFLDLLVWWMCTSCSPISFTVWEKNRRCYPNPV